MNKKKLQKAIKTHGLTLLNLYGVKEKLIKENPWALNAFVELLSDEILKISSTTTLNSKRLSK